MLKFCNQKQTKSFFFMQREISTMLHFFQCKILRPQNKKVFFFMQTVQSLHDEVTKTCHVDSTGCKLEHCLKRIDACIQWTNKIYTEDIVGDFGCTKKGAVCMGAEVRGQGSLNGTRCQHSDNVPHTSCQWSSDLSKQFLTTSGRVSDYHCQANWELSDYSTIPALWSFDILS